MRGIIKTILFKSVNRDDSHFNTIEASGYFYVQPNKFLLFVAPQLGEQPFVCDIEETETI